MQKTEAKCQNCPNNPDAKKPYVEMKHINLDSSSLKRIEEHGLKVDCFVCGIVEEFVKALA